MSTREKPAALVALVAVCLPVGEIASAFAPIPSHTAAVGRPVEPRRERMGKPWTSNGSDVNQAEQSKSELNPRGFEQELLKQQQDLQSLMRERSGTSAISASTVGGMSMDRDKEEESGASIGYGFVSRSEWRRHSDSRRPTEPKDDNVHFYEPPSNIVTLAMQQFGRNFQTMIGRYDEDKKADDEQVALQNRLADLKLSSGTAADLEDISGVLGVMKEPLLLRAPYHLVCPMFEWGTHLPHRFYLMETVGRAPYLSFLSLLNLYEACGLWRPTEDVRVAHVLQELSKFHRVRIMEELGGDQPWMVRAAASHAALFVQVTCAHLWLISPSLAYRFALMIESYAFHTYDKFLEENEEILKQLPAPPVATEKLMTAEEMSTRKAGATLYDVFDSIRGDSAYHAMALKGSYDPYVALRAPSTEKKVFAGLAVALMISSLLPHALGDGTYFSLLEKMPGWP